MFYGFWNLNIFHPLYHSLCLSPRMSNLQAATLQYSIGFYPLLLLALILVLVRLRDSGCRGIVWICRPIHWCLAHFRKNFDIHSSLTDAFSTFIILSYIKIGYTSFYILVPTKVYQPDGSYDWYILICRALQSIPSWPASSHLLCSFYSWFSLLHSSIYDSVLVPFQVFPEVSQLLWSEVFDSTCIC